MSNLPMFKFTAEHYFVVVFCAKIAFLNFSTP